MPFLRSDHPAQRLWHSGMLRVIASVFLAAGCAGRTRGTATTPSPVVTDVTDVTDVTPPALMVPVDGVSPRRVPDTFNAVRAGRTHRAIDIVVPRGTAVLAAASGQVYRIRHTGPGGLAVYATDSTRRWMFYYAHLDSFREGLVEGMTLAQGDLIGFVGTTGNAPPDTPHLHFQLMHARFDARWWDGEALDPRAYFVKTGEPR